MIKEHLAFTAGMPDGFYEKTCDFESSIRLFIVVTQALPVTFKNIVCILAV